jgi:transcriptional regulator with XRE-family HTH domain
MTTGPQEQQNISTMARTTAALLPATQRRFKRLGERLRLARLRRKLTAKEMAERAGMVPMTLRSLERGGPGVTVGAYLSVLQVLGLDSDLELLAQADTAGRALQDAQLPQPRKPPARARAKPPPRRAPPAKTATSALSVPGNMTSDAELAELLSPAPETKQRKRR